MKETEHFSNSSVIKSNSSEKNMQYCIFHTLHLLHGSLKILNINEMQFIFDDFLQKFYLLDFFLINILMFSFEAL